MSKPFFGDIKPVKYEGPKSDNPYAFRRYDPKKIVMGKTMADWLRPAVCYWHNFAWLGTDMFGAPTFERPWDGETMKGARAKADVGVRNVHNPRLPVLRLPRSRRRAGGRESGRVRQEPRAR